MSSDPGRNLLGEATSPYLLQHAHNPVHWRPWGAEALAEAQAARLADPALDRLRRLPLVPCDGARVVRGRRNRRLMNCLFVNVKVDREERPDIDHIYMTALHAMGQQGGWPLTMFLDARRRADVRRHLLAAGAALGPPVVPADPRSRSTTPGATSRAGAGASAADARPPIWRSSRAPRPGRGLTPDDLTRVGDGLLARRSIRVNGGIGGAPKFPNAPIFRFFWNEMFRRGDASVRATPCAALLDALCAGGIYDHLGGGFARYSTDARMARAAFREDALRQRANSRIARAGARRGPTRSMPRGRARRSAG